MTEIFSNKMSRSGVPPDDNTTATPAVSRTEPELRVAILEQTARVSGNSEAGGGLGRGGRGDNTTWTT